MSKTYNARYMFLDPQPEAVEAESAEEAASMFLDNHGGRDQGNWGRCVVVIGQDNDETRWAFIRTGVTEGKLEEILNDHI